MQQSISNLINLLLCSQRDQKHLLKTPTQTVDFSSLMVFGTVAPYNSTGSTKTRYVTILLHHITFCHTICCFQFLSITICLGVWTSNCVVVFKKTTISSITEFGGRVNVTFRPLCDVMKRHVTVSVPRSDCRVYSVFSLLKHAVDLIFHVQTEKNIIPLRVFECSVKPDWISAHPSYRQRMQVVEHKEPFNKTSSPKQIKYR